MFYYRKKQMWIFDDNDKQAARMVSVIDFLTRHYGFTFKQIGRIYRCQQHDSLVVKADERTWYWNSRRIGGGDVLEFVMKYENKTYAQALEIVINPSQEEATRPQYQSAPLYTHKFVFFFCLDSDRNDSFAIRANVGTIPSVFVPFSEKSIKENSSFPL